MPVVTIITVGLLILFGTWFGLFSFFMAAFLWESHLAIRQYLRGVAVKSTAEYERYGFADEGGDDSTYYRTR